MGIKSIVDDIDSVDEVMRAHYKETDGKWVLDVDDVDSHPKVRNLKTAFEKQKTRAKEINDELIALKARFDGLPEEFDVSEYERLVAAGKDVKPDEKLAELKVQLEKKHDKERTELSKQIQGLQSQLQKVVMDDGLLKGLVDAGVAKEYIAASKALLKDKGIIKMVEEDGNYKVIVETDLGPMPLDKFLPEWVAGDEGKPFVAKPSGGDANGGNGRKVNNEANPWKKETRNLTQQGQLLKHDKIKAQRLMKDAGLDQASISVALGTPAAS